MEDKDFSPVGVCHGFVGLLIWGTLGEDLLMCKLSLSLFCNFPLCFRQINGINGISRNFTQVAGTLLLHHLVNSLDYECTWAHPHPLHSFGNQSLSCDVPRWLPLFSDLAIWALQAPALDQDYFGSWIIPAGNWKEEGIRSFHLGFTASHTHVMLNDSASLQGHWLLISWLSSLQFDLAVFNSKHFELWFFTVDTV